MKFDVYVNTDKDTNKAYPSFIDIQNNLLDILNSRVVIPLTLVKNADKNYPETLCPTIRIKDRNYAFLTHQITSVPINIPRKKELSAEASRNQIVTAIDFVVTGI